MTLMKGDEDGDIVDGDEEDEGDDTADGDGQADEGNENKDRKDELSLIAVDVKISC
ncbi:hypothetical protein KIN20_020587 [Parelaphostrongylus tenuis]|uniref:Uncharacterized protein n=1 Tax=Parelaphostrongylus tenuis TaxID=148309 RepID=A0AAD5QQZ6_PARTN|nr:hypothetical protein KIN20_020587 [Parelaphostrongylus tenuis]